jgi:hypothetical protein
MPPGRTIVERTASTEGTPMASPAASPENLNDGTYLGLVKWSDWHRLRGRDDGQADAGDESSRDELPHDGFSWVDEVTLTKPLCQRDVIFFIIPFLVDRIDRLVQSRGGTVAVIFTINAIAAASPVHDTCRISFEPYGPTAPR